MQELTPSQTVGPFFGFALPFEAGPEVAPGGGLVIEGSVYDGAGQPVPDALVEIWQPDPAGVFPERVADDGFRGWGRCGTDSTGRFWFRTVKPGSAEPGAAPHVGVIVHARGVLQHLMTRMYFPDEEAANAADPVLGLIPEDRRATLIARAVSDDGGHPSAGGEVLRFDIHLQGDHETVFFDA